MTEDNKNSLDNMDLTLTETINRKILKGEAVIPHHSEEPSPDVDDFMEDAPTIQLNRRAITGVSNTGISKEELTKEDDLDAIRSLVDEEVKEEPKPQKVTQKKSNGKRLLKISCHNCLQKLDVTHLEGFLHFNCPACEADLIVPKWFDNYLLEEPGGVGGMAVVYRALDLALDREVAIKVLSPNVASDKERGELFLHEARTSATLNHYAIIPIYTCGEFDGQPYLVMQFMAGGALEDRLEANPNGYPISDVMKWLHDVSEGLNNALRHGIIHHDIKPGNLMLDVEGNVKVGDFGIAQAVNDAREHEISKLTEGWISPHYVSPEKVAEGKEGSPGDIYSLGATFYNLVTGTTPFENDDMDQLIRMRLFNTPRAPKELRSEIPKQFSDLIMKMMSKEPNDRPTYEEIIATLEKIKLSRTVGVRKKQQQQKSLKANNDAMQRLNKASLDSKLNRKKPVFRYVLLVLLLILGGIGYYLYSTNQLQPLVDRTKAYINNEPLDIPFNYTPKLIKLCAAGDSIGANKLAQEIFDNPVNSMEKRREAAVICALTHFLNNTEDGVDKITFLLDHLNVIQNRKEDEVDSYGAILFFMTTRKPGSQLTVDTLGNEKYINVLGHFSIFLRAMYNNEPKDKVLEAFNAFEEASKNTSQKYWGNAWRTRLALWGSCLRGEDISGKTIEPIFKKYSTSKSLVKKAKQHTITTSKKLTNMSDVTEEWLENERIYAIERPSSLDFSISKSEADKYFKSLATEAPDVLAREKRTLEFVSGLKKELCLMMGKKLYSGTIVTRDRKRIKGQVRAVPDLITIRTVKRKYIRLKWNKLPEWQFIALWKYYAKLAEQKGDTQKAAAIYVKLAVFADWFKQYRSVEGFIKKAIELDRNSEATLESYFIK